jgi:death-on-curing protein
MGLLESALARPLNRAVYAEVSVFDLAAAYAFGIVGNHPVVDGNKRVAFLAAALFCWNMASQSPRAIRLW